MRAADAGCAVVFTLAMRAADAGRAVVFTLAALEPHLASHHSRKVFFTTQNGTRSSEPPRTPWFSPRAEQ